MTTAKHTPGPWVEIDKMNPATWERTGETMPDGAPVLFNPGNGLPCVMPRPSWPNPHTPRSVQVYRSEARDQLDKAAPDMLAALKKAESFISGFEDDDLQEGIADLLAGIRAAIAKADSASQSATDCREYDWRNG